MNLGFDPWPHWTWHEGPVFVDPPKARERMNQWLQVRHAIAHGDDDLPNVDVLTEVQNGKRSITRPNAEACMNFFMRTVAVTTDAALDEFDE